MWDRCDRQADWVGRGNSLLIAWNEPQYHPVESPSSTVRCELGRAQTVKTAFTTTRHMQRTGAAVGALSVQEERKCWSSPSPKA